MSRSGYDDGWDFDGWATIRWRGAVKSAIRGKRGQAFLQEMLEAMAALPERKLIDSVLEDGNGAVCAIGSVGKKRGLDMHDVDPEDTETVAKLFNIPHSLACEIVYMNDEATYSETPDQRFERMRQWVEENLYDGASTVSSQDRAGK